MKSPCSRNCSTKNNGIHYLLHTKFLDDKWIADIGASQHILEIFSSLINHTKITLLINLSQKIKVKGVGKIVLSENIFLNDVLCIPEFRVNLIADSTTGFLRFSDIQNQSLNAKICR